MMVFLRTSVLVGIVALICMTSIPGAAGDVVSADWKTNGDGLVTRDLVNGKEWLDLTETLFPGSPNLNRTYNDIVSQLGLGGEFEGFRHATESEIIEFWTSAGIPNINSGGTLANFTPTKNLIELIGMTSASTGITQFSNGIYGGTIAANTHQSAMLEKTETGQIGRARTMLQNVDDDRSTLVGGHFLVRATAVPEPVSPAFLLLLGCLVGVFQPRRKNKLSNSHAIESL